MSNVAHKLHEETNAAQVLKENLRDLIGEDDVLLRDMIEGETGLLEAIDATVKQIGFDEALVKGLSDHINELRNRKQRILDRIQGMRSALLAAMSMAEIKKRETPAGTIARKAIPPSVQLTDEAAIPSEFWKPQDPKLDKAALEKALKEKREIPGAVLTNGGETIQVRFT